MPFMSVLPNELWMSVFESLNNPSDLAKVLRTSKRFHDMAIRVLHRRLIWNDPRHFAESLNFWTNNAGTLNVPRILTVGISKMPPPQAHVERLDRVVAVVALNGALTHMPVTGGAPPALFVPLIPPPDTPNTTSKPCFVAAADLYTAMTNLMVTFNQLSNLHFRNAILPINIYGIIHGLHSLRCLRIEFCSFEAGTVDGPWDPATLPITELSLLGIESGNTNIRALSIAKARDLRILRFDASAFVAKLIVDAGGAFIVPQNLEYVDVRLPDKKLWPSSPHEAQALYITPLTGFLSMCPNVVRLSIGAFMPEFILRDNVLPNLRRYKGPISTVVTVAGRRPIYELNICDAGSKISDLTDALTLLGNSHSTLEELSVYVPYWDDEILYAVTQLFPNLRKLHIRYALGSPSEVCYQLALQFDRSQ